MDSNTLAALALAALALAVPCGIIVLSAIAGPVRRRRRTDMTPYECGVKPFVSARGRFSVKFYLVAMLFIIFDIEAIFLYPWAVTVYDQRGGADGWPIFLVMMVFLVILTVGFVYEWGRGALDWDK